MIWYNNYDAVNAMRHRLVEDWHGKPRGDRRSRGLRLAARDESVER